MVEGTAGHDLIGPGKAGGVEQVGAHMRAKGQYAQASLARDFVTSQVREQIQPGLLGLEIQDEGFGLAVGQTSIEHFGRADGSAGEAESVGGGFDSRGPEKIGGEVEYHSSLLDHRLRSSSVPVNGSMTIWSRAESVVRRRGHEWSVAFVG
jgi:hypothetical protein